MKETEYQRTLRERDLVVAKSSRTTLLYGRMDGTCIRQHLPFADMSLRESAITAWGEACKDGKPDPREVCHLLIRHPCLEEVWTVGAKMVLRHYPKHEEWVGNVIPHAQGTVWIVYADNQEAFEEAAARPSDRFPGFGYEFIVHRCQESCHYLSGRGLWPDSMDCEQLSVVECEPIARGTDVVALVLGDELRLIIEKYDDQTHTLIDSRLEGLKENEIAARMGISRHQLYRMSEKIKDQLGRDLKVRGFEVSV